MTTFKEFLISLAAVILFKTEFALPAWAIFCEPIFSQSGNLTAQRASGMRGDPTFQLAFQAVGSKRLHQVI